jgi:hypothetical protein
LSTTTLTKASTTTSTESKNIIDEYSLGIMGYLKYEWNIYKPTLLYQDYTFKHFYLYIIAYFLHINQIISILCRGYNYEITDSIILIILSWIINDIMYVLYNF